MDIKLIAEILGIIGALGAVALAIWRSGKTIQKLEDRLASVEDQIKVALPKAAHELEMERLRGQLASKISAEGLSDICQERHRIYDQAIEDLKRSLSGTGAQASVAAFRERVDRLAGELHEKLNTESMNRTAEDHKLSRDLVVLQNGVSELVRTKNVAEAAVIQQAADFRGVETTVASLQEQATRMEARIRDGELELVRLQASQKGR